MSKRLQLLAGIVVTGFFVSSFSPVQAQTADPTRLPSDSEASVSALTSEPEPDMATYSGMTVARDLVFEQERAVIRAQYRTAIQEYQRSLRTFTLARAQYQQLGTLASLEDAVTATRQVLKDRVHVLINFFDLLHLELRAGPGMDPDKKQAALRKIEELRTELQNQEQLITNSQDRVAIAARVGAYMEKAQEIETHSHYVRALLLAGRLYRSYQEALGFFAEIKAQHQASGGSTLLQAQRQRAYGEIDALTTQIDIEWQQIFIKLFEEGDKSKEWYQALVVMMSQVQSDILRLYAYLAELAQL